MAKISGAAYLIIGIFVALVSYFTKNTSLKIFIYVGFAFGIVGIIKILFTRSSKENKNKTIRQHLSKQHIRKNQKEQSNFTKYCNRCGNLARNFDNFCSRCGQALFQRRR